MTRIITTAIVESWRRWAEDELANKMPESAFDKVSRESIRGRACWLPVRMTIDWLRR